LADLLMDEQGAPVTPASGQMVIYPDSGNSQWVQKNDSGIYLGDQSRSRTTQIASHSADTYYLGLQLPSFSMQAGMVFEWYFTVTKGAAGTATPVYTVRIGANQATTDTSRLAMTGPAQTAAADTAFIRVMVTCRTVSGTGVLQGMVWLQHNLAATGFANTPAGFSLVQATSAGFDNTALGGQFIGLSVNPGASGAWVVEQVLARCWY
jgi:hypothetical protein